MIRFFILIFVGMGMLWMFTGEVFIGFLHFIIAIIVYAYNSEYNSSITLQEENTKLKAKIKRMGK